MEYFPGHMGFGHGGLVPDPRVTALMQKLGLEKYEKNLVSAEVDWDSLLMMKEPDLAEIGLPKGARIKVRQAVREASTKHQKGRSGRKQNQQVPFSPDQEPPLPVGEPPPPAPVGGAAKKMAHLQITPPGSQQGSSGAGQGSGEKEGSPSNTMPSLDSLKSIWNTTPTGVLTPYATAPMAIPPQPYRQEASPALPRDDGDVDAVAEEVLSSLHLGDGPLGERGIDAPEAPSLTGLVAETPQRRRARRAR